MLIDKKITILIIYSYFLFLCSSGYYFFNNIYPGLKFQNRNLKNNDGKTIFFKKTLSIFSSFAGKVGEHMLNRNKYSKAIIQFGGGDTEYEENYMILKPEILMGYKIIISILFFSGAAVFAGKIGANLLFSLMAGIAGFFAPDIIKKILINKKVRELEEELPYFIDILYVTNISGQNIYNAFKIICHENDGSIYREFKRFISDINFGRGKLDAYNNLKKNSHSEEFKNLIRMLEAAEKYGSPVNDLLREKSMQLRFNHKQASERKARKTAVLCLFPLIFLILPAFALLVGGPLLYAIGGDFLSFFTEL